MKYIFSAKPMKMSENEQYIESEAFICYYDAPNLNGLELSSETAKECAQSLVNQPVDAKYSKTAGKDDLGGHEIKTDANGNALFGTESIGTHTSVEFRDAEVETADGEKKTLPCLFAKSRIWKRNKNMCAAIRRLFDEGRLHSSYVLRPTEDATEKDGKSVLRAYKFESNTLLGTKHMPAYPQAGVLSMASLDGDEECLALALAADFQSAEKRIIKRVTVVTEVFSFDEEGNSESTFEQRSNCTEELVDDERSAIPASDKEEEMSEHLATLEAENAKLKKELDDYERKEREAALTAKRATLREKLQKCALFSASDLETAEVKKALDDADENAVNALIASQAVANVKKPLTRPQRASFDNPLSWKPTENPIEGILDQFIKNNRGG